MILRDLMADVCLRQPLPSQHASLNVTDLAYDSRRVAEGTLFFAFQGAKADGRQFAQAALAKGAIGVASDQAAPVDFRGIWLEVEHGRRALSQAARNFYGHPDRRIHLTGITGTNGKTTTTYLIESILKAAGKLAGVVGTVEYRIGNTVLPAANTTPESLDLARICARVADIGGSHLVAEVSSHALFLGRVDSFFFHTAVFTNLTRDHLDLHGDMASYAAAKRLLFAPSHGPAPACAVLNADDPAWVGMRPAAPTRVITYGTSDAAMLRATDICTSFDGLQFTLNYEGQFYPVHSPLVALFNVANILAAIGVGLSYDLPLATILAGIATCSAVPGRFERVDTGQPFLVVVDYAHTDDALRNAIQTARALLSAPDARVITLFGCGGDRDRTKRPLMGMAAAELSDYVVLTSDNPRSEDPLAIINDAAVGLRRYDTPHATIPDRSDAIRAALAQARTGDVVLLAGKGHEHYQILQDQTIAFDDRAVAREHLSALGFGAGVGVTR
jgi:UDP-N-acetylmuramoyl-L-alanyl-D-glutamate--2,6-diaminopimelate ligase